MFQVAMVSGRAEGVSVSADGRGGIGGWLLGEGPVSASDWSRGPCWAVEGGGGGGVERKSVMRV